MNADFDRAEMSPRHWILDRDGVVNVSPGSGWVLDPGDWEWERGVLSALAALTAAGARVSIVTNQSCIGRGLVGHDAIDRVHARARAEAARAGARIDEIFVCPHSPSDACSCRKPKPGMVHAAIASSGIVAEMSVLVGDSPRDLVAARAAGVRPVLVRTGHGRQTEQACVCDGVAIFDDLRTAVMALGFGPPP